jgi:hypothetical protein
VLKSCKTIPTTDLEVLKERLEITCEQYERLRPLQEQRGQHDLNIKTWNKRTRQAYLTILDRQPHAFPAFILSVSPRACRSFDAHTYCDIYSDLDEIVFDDAVGQSLNDIAREPNKAQSLKNIFNSISEPPPTISEPPPTISEQPPTISEQPPTTTATNSSGCWEYDHAKMSSLSGVFGVQTCKSIENHPHQTTEREDPTFTKLVRVRLPWQDFSDAMIWLDIGYPVSDFVEAIFPSEYQAVFWLIRTESPSGDARSRQRREVKNASFTLKGASMQGIRSVFEPTVCQALQRSEKRQWEIRQGLLEETDCLTMDIMVESGKAPLATISLRVAWQEAYTLICHLY